MKDTKVQYYSPRMMEKRRQFNNIINGIDMVLMNNIVDVDEDIYHSFEGDSPLNDCDVVDMSNAPDDIKEEYTSTYEYWCQEHEEPSELTDSCDRQGEGAEVYQWFAINPSDADFLKRHGQYVAYSDKLDTYFLAICHYGTGWDYVDSMVEAFNDCYTGLEDFSPVDETRSY